MIDYWSHEETDDPGYADQRNFYKVEKRSGDGQRVEEMTVATQHIFERFYSETTKIGANVGQRT